MAGVLAILLARVDRADRWRSVTLWPPVLFLAMMCLSIAMSDLPAISITRSATMPVHAMAFVLVQVAAWHRPALQTILASALIALIGLGLDPIVELATGSPLFTQLGAVTADRVSGSQGNPNDFAASAILMPLAVAAWGADRRTMGTVVAAVIATPCWAITASRQTLLGWLVAIAINLPTRRLSKRSWWIAGGLAAGVVAVILALPVTRERLNQTLEGNLSGRPGLIAFGLSLVVDHPMTGIGPGVFGEYYVDAVATGWTWRGTRLRQYGVPWVHNLPLEVTVELGISGLLAAGAIVTAASRRVLNTLRHAHNPEWTTVALAAGGGILVWLVVGQFDLTLLKDWFRCLFWTTIGLAFALPPVKRDSSGNS